jgi:hypothetical protein
MTGDVSCSQMARAQEVDRILAKLFIWQAYDQTVKADLFSTGLETSAGICLVDPISLGPTALLDLEAQGKIARIFVTNANHTRAARQFAATFRVPVFANATLRGDIDLADVTGVRDGEAFSEGLTGIAIDGGPAGEMAVHFADDGGSMILGDALINFEPHGFGLLPAKYCLDFKLMRQSLQKLLSFPFQRMFFAHGTPILSDARVGLEHLLAKRS